MQQKENHFIKNIEIKNFKCFKDFKAEGFGRVNLIGGKNNVGKTAFMEACYLSRQELNATIEELFIDLMKILNLRNKKINIYEFNTIFSSLLNKEFTIKSSQSILNLKSFTEYTKKNIKFFGQFIEIQGIKFDKGNYPIVTNLLIKNFIPSDSINNRLIELIFDEIKAQRKRDKLNKYISNFDENILEFDFIQDVPKIFNKNFNAFMDIYESGHGLKRYISIISALIVNNNGYLFLDEIENGIHYTNLDKLWEIILTISKEQNVQVFATTHSKECIESYARVAKRLEDEEITMTVLARNLKNELKALVYDDKMFYSELEQNHEVRGW